MVSLDFRRQFAGFGLTTANILYHLPDHPDILQSFIWQNHDLLPHFPELRWAAFLGGEPIAPHPAAKKKAVTAS